MTHPTPTQEGSMMDYGLRYTVTRRDTTTVTLQRFFPSSEARGRFLAKLERRPNFVRIDAYTDPPAPVVYLTEADVEPMSRDEKLVLAWAINRAPGFQRPVAEPHNLARCGGVFAAEALASARAGDDLTLPGQALADALLARLR